MFRILDDTCLEMSKVSSCLYFCIRGLKPTYAGLFLLHRSILEALRMWGWVCVRGVLPTYMGLDLCT